MAISASFRADFSDFTAAVAKAEVSLKSFEGGAGKVETSLNKMVNSFSGTKVIQEAALMSEAFDRLQKQGIGLTTAELQRMGITAQAAVDKLRAMGQDVPPGIQKIADATKGATQQTLNWKGALTTAAGAFGVAFSVGAIVNFGKSVFDSASQIHDLALQLGVSTDAAQGFKFAAEQAGSSVEAVGTALTKMNVNLAGGDKATVQALKDAGLGFEAIRSMKPEDAFLAITDAIAKIPDPMKQSDVALQIFGRSAAELLPAIKEGFRGAAEGASKMSAQTIKDLEAAQDAWAKVGREFTIITGGVIADLMRIPEATKQVTSSFSDLSRFMTDVAVNGWANATLHAVNATKALNQNKDINLALAPAIKKTADELSAAAAAAKQYASAFASMFGKFSGASATAEMNMLDAVFRKMAASGKITELQINAMVKEAIKLQGAGATLTPQLLEMVRVTNAWSPALNTAALDFSKLGTQVAIGTAKLWPFGVAVQAGSGDWGNLSRTVSKPDIPDAVKKATDSVGELARAFSQLATVSSGAFGSLVRDLGTLVTAFDTATKAQKAFSDGKKEYDGEDGEDGNKFKGIVGMASGIMGIAAAAIAATKAIKNMFFASEGRDMVKEFAGTFGGFDALHVELNALGEEGERLWIALTQGVGKNNPAQAQAAIDAITKALDKQNAAAAAGTITSEAEAQATIETAAQAALALEELNGRLVTNREQWGEWSEDVTGYLQRLADDIRAMPLPTPTGVPGSSGSSAGSATYRGGGGAPRGGGGDTYINNITQLDGEVITRSVVKIAKRRGLTN